MQVNMANFCPRGNYADYTGNQKDLSSLLNQDSIYDFLQRYLLYKDPWKINPDEKVVVPLFIKSTEIKMIYREHSQ